MSRFTGTGGVVNHIFSFLAQEKESQIDEKKDIVKKPLDIVKLTNDLENTTFSSSICGKCSLRRSFEESNDGESFGEKKLETIAPKGIVKQKKLQRKKRAKQKRMKKCLCGCGFMIRYENKMCSKSAILAELCEICGKKMKENAMDKSLE